MVFRSGRGFVLDPGQMVEHRPAGRMLTGPRTDYAQRLLAAAPRLLHLNQKGIAVR
jgi:ABC-type dipeptide/oligopeptide/nickel transport system ATPase component